MGDSEEEISTQPGLVRPGSTQPSSSAGSSSRSPRGWFKALTALSALGFTAFVVFPKLLKYFDRALESTACADWKVWIPSLVLSLLVLGALAPTSLKDMGALVGTAGDLLSKLKGGGK
jgi:hypothetical protein